MLAPSPDSGLAATKDLRTVPIYFSMVVWGEAFVGFFLEFCLPTLLAPNNIAAIRHRTGSRFVLHTHESDLPVIERSPAFARLKQTIDVDIRSMQWEGIAPHDALSRCHRETMTLADERGLPVIFLSPDTLWSDGSIAAVDRLLTGGKRVIFLSSFRLVKEDAEPYLRSRFGDRDSVELAVGARELNRIAQQFLHPTIEEYFFEPGRGTALSPMLLLWTAPNGDILGHGFHQHPLLVYPTRRFADFVQTIDGDLVDGACPDPRYHYVVQDSDEITAIELSKRAQYMQGFMAKSDSTAVAAWAFSYANRIHWSIFPTPIRMHANPVDATEWSDVEARASAVVADIINYRRKRVLLVHYNDLFYWAAKKTLGMSRPETQEWLFRRRHAISFHVRNTFFRARHLIIFHVRNTTYRVGHAARQRLSPHWHRVDFMRRDFMERRRFELGNRVYHRCYPVTFFIRDWRNRRRYELRDRAYGRLHAATFPLREAFFRLRHACRFYVDDWMNRRRFELRDRIHQRCHPIGFYLRDWRDRRRFELRDRIYVRARKIASQCRGLIGVRRQDS